MKRGWGIKTNFGNATKQPIKTFPLNKLAPRSQRCLSKAFVSTCLRPALEEKRRKEGKKEPNETFV
jgi:hypothetical protein